MKEFFDTSVLVAAFWGGHRDHPASIKLLGAATRKQSACSIHTLAEVYAAMTALPIKPILPPEQVMLFVQEVRDRLTLVSLDEGEYFRRSSAPPRRASPVVASMTLSFCAVRPRQKPKPSIRGT